MTTTKITNFINNEFIINEDNRNYYYYKYINVVLRKDDEEKITKHALNEYNKIPKENLINKPEKVSNTHLLEKKKEYDLKLDSDENFEKKTIQNFTEDEILTANNCYFSIFLKYTNIIVIDVDEDIELNSLPKFLLKFPYTKGNTKGYHFYIKLLNKPKNWVGSEQDVFKDFKGDIIGWKNNIWEKEEKKIYNYNSKTFIPIDFNDLNILLKSIEERKKRKEKKEKEEKKENNENNEIITRNIEFNPIKYDVVQKIIDKCLIHTSEKSQRFNFWVNMTYLLKNEFPQDKALSLYIYYSQKHQDKNKIDSIEKLTKDFKEKELKNINEDKITIGTLFKEAKECNEKEFKKIKKEYQEYFEKRNREIEESIKDEYKNLLKFFELSNNEIADFFKDEVIKDVKITTFEKSRIYYYYDYNFNIWKKSDSNNKILNIFSDLIHAYIKKNEENTIYNIDTIDEEEKKIINNINKIIISEKKRLTLKTSLEQYYSRVTQYLIDDNILDKLDMNKDILSFKNCILDLRTGETRKRVREDYQTQYLNYDYIDYKNTEDENKKINEIKNDILKKVLNNDDELVNFMLNFLAVCLTGHTIRKFLFMYGYCKIGSNGKTTIAEIYKYCLPIYYYECNRNLLNKDNKTSHKDLMNIISNKRFVNVPEIPEKEIDTSLLKGLCDSSFNNEIIFKANSEGIKINFKLYITSNHKMIYTNDGGMETRGLAIECKNKFVDKGSEELENYNKGIIIDNMHIYEKKLNFSEKFNDENSYLYKLAFIHLLLPYVINFYKNKREIEFPKQVLNMFNKISSNNNNIKTFFDDTFEITNKNTQDRILIDDFIEDYKNYFSKPINRPDALKIINTTIGIEYKKDMKLDGLNKDDPRKNMRGIIIGLKKK